MSVMDDCKYARFLVLMKLILPSQNSLLHLFLSAFSTEIRDFGLQAVSCWALLWR